MALWENLVESGRYEIMRPFSASISFGCVANTKWTNVDNDNKIQFDRLLFIKAVTLVSYDNAYSESEYEDVFLGFEFDRIFFPFDLESYWNSFGGVIYIGYPLLTKPLKIPVNVLVSANKYWMYYYMNKHPTASYLASLFYEGYELAEVPYGKKLAPERELILGVEQIER